jgi:hypothetical protein
MRIWKIGMPLLLVFVVSFTCKWFPAPDTPAATPTPTSAGLMNWTPGAGTCQIVATGTVDIRNRPSLASQLFSHLSAGDRQDVTALTADGWAGFDPGIAQAPNIPAFHSRWVQLGADAHLEGACASIPFVVGPPPGICFAMIWETEPVYALADTSSAVLATLHQYDYAALLELAGDWARVDLSVGNVGMPVQGWIQNFDINTDGPCAALGTPTTTVTPTMTPTATITSTPTAAAYHPVFTPGAGACEVVATGPATLYTRPSLASDVFSTFTAGDRHPAMAYTADGFIGFDPAYAQAGNVGVFRYRWVLLGPNVHLEGNCGSLPLVVGPPPGVCFVMAYEHLSVYANPLASSAVLATMEVGDYAQLIERAAGWMKVDLSVGNLGLPIQGWIQDGSAGLNGPCDGVITSTPVATLTLAPAAKVFTFFPKVTPDHIFYRGTNCGPKEVQFYLSVSDPTSVRRVDLYYRLRDQATTKVTDWNNKSMNPAGDGGFLVKLLSESIPGFGQFELAWLQYQFVAVDAKEQVIARSEVYWNIVVSACHK